MRSFLTNILFYIFLYGIRASCETREFHCYFYFFFFSMASTISLNVANFVTLKLTPENYPLWREQMLALAESQDMVGLLTGEKMKPTMYINVTTERASTSEGTDQQISEDFLKWRKEDRLLRGWIIGTLTEETLGLVIGLDSSQSVWNALKEAYAQDS